MSHVAVVPAKCCYVFYWQSLLSLHNDNDNKNCKF